MPAPAPDHDEVVRLYGPWAARTPADAVALLQGYPGRWWVAGGWAVEAFTGVSRPHGDLDLSIPRRELPLLRRHLAGRLDLWAADQGSLRPVAPDDDGTLSRTCENLWLRRGGADPWEYDVLLMDVEPADADADAADGATWVYKRDHRLTRPLGGILWSRDGVTYLRPEVQLLHKARGLRPQDQADLDAAWPLLSHEQRVWLRDAVALTEPGHPWLART